MGSDRTLAADPSVTDSAPTRAGRPQGKAFLLVNGDGVMSKGGNAFRLQVRLPTRRGRRYRPHYR
jgi:hypothetical protein